MRLMKQKLTLLYVLVDDGVGKQYSAHFAQQQLPAVNDACNSESRT